MTTIVTRAGKGSPLTHTEVDTNFTNLNTAKLETAAIPLGTLGAPSISFLNYSTTGIYSPAGNELGVSMLGSDKIRIKSTGEIIINATASRTILGVTPRLQVEGTTANSQCSLSLTGAGVGSLNPRLYFSKARSSANAVVLEDDILGVIFFNGGDGSSLVNAGFIKAEVDGTPSAGIVPGRLVFTTVDTAGSSGERMIIKNNGNVSIDGTTFHVDAVNNRVGLGTSSPSEKLTVSGGSIDLPTVNTYIKGGGHNVLQVDATTTYFYGGTSGVQLRTADNASALVNITNAGLVGIGTTSPGGILDVSGTGDQLVRFQSSAAMKTRLVTGNSDVAAIEFSDGTAYRAKIQVETSDAMSFYTGGITTEVARLDSSGRLLVGTSAIPGAGELLRVKKASTGTDGAGINFEGSYSLDDDASQTVSIASSSLITITNENNLQGGLLFATYASATITIISDPSSIIATNDEDGKLCLFKSANNSNITVKNRLGANKSFVIGRLTT